MSPLSPCPSFVKKRSVHRYERKLKREFLEEEKCLKKVRVELENEKRMLEYGKQECEEAKKQQKEYARKMEYEVVSYNMSQVECSVIEIGHCFRKSCREK